jgi:hypothetical protein
VAGLIVERHAIVLVATAGEAMAMRAAARQKACFMPA